MDSTSTRYGCSVPCSVTTFSPCLLAITRASMPPRRIARTISSASEVVPACLLIPDPLPRGLRGFLLLRVIRPFFNDFFSIESLPTKLLTDIGRNYACPRLLCHTVLHACRALTSGFFDFPFRISNPTITRSVSDKSPMILQIGTGRLRTSVGMASI
jgi:hypothetical protein